MKFLMCSVTILLFFSFVCLAQETYHNEEFGFTIDIPSDWYITFRDELSNNDRDMLGELYWSKNLLLLNPSGTNALDVPSILVQTIKERKSLTSKQISRIKRKSQEMMTSSLEKIFNELFGEEIEQYREIDNFYDYDSSRNIAIVKIVYESNFDSNIYLVTAYARALGLKVGISFRGYWKGQYPEDFQAVFDEIIDSFEFDQGVGVPNMTSKELSQDIGKKTFGLIYKVCGSFFGIMILIWFLKKVFGS